MKNRIEELISALRSINRADQHKVPESITSDDQPCYWQRQEWIDWVLGIADELEEDLTHEVNGRGKYDEVLIPFTTMMEAELHANTGKGDRPGWLTMSPDKAMLEIYYHSAKLQKAMRDDNPELVGEYAADVANGAMMAADLYLDLPARPARLKRMEPRLDAPAQVGGTRFGVGIAHSTVIKRAQREVEYARNPIPEEQVQDARRMMAEIQEDLENART